MADPPSPFGDTVALCVFCGSSIGASPGYRDAALALGRAMARQGIELVYGGGRVGLMGVIADAVLAEGGRVTGVMPKSLVAREIAHADLSCLVVVETMHERKARMAELAEGFIALPGGAGTMDEIFEQWTWAQLGIHAKPCGFLNVGGYFDPLRTMIERMVGEGFLRPEYLNMLVFDTNVESLLSRFRAYEPPARKWAQSERAV